MDELVFAAARIRDAISDGSPDAVDLTAIYLQEAIAAGRFAGLQYAEFRKIVAEAFRFQSIGGRSFHLVRAAEWLSQFAGLLGLSIPQVPVLEQSLWSGGTWPGITIIESHLSVLADAIAGGVSNEAPIVQANAIEDSTAATHGRVTDPEGYVLVNTLWPDRFKNYKKFKTWLDSIPESEIRRQKPNPQRIEVYLIDWAKYWAKEDRQQSESLCDEAVQEMIADVEARKAVEQSRKRKSR